MNPDTSQTKARILCIADIPDWIFARHVSYLQKYLCEEFEISTAYRGQAFDEDAYDLIYPLEFMLVEPGTIASPRKYVTGIRSFISWTDWDFLSLTELLRARFQRVHTVSRELYNIFDPYIPALAHVSHGVDLELFTPRRSAPAEPGRLRLGWAGNRSTIVKGFAAYIAPLAQIPGVELVYHGLVDQHLALEEMPAFYEGIDAYISTSSTEGNNNSLLEAAAMECAIITTNVGAASEYLQDQHSALFVERDLEQIRQAVIELRDHPEKRLALGKQARRQLLEQGWDWKTRAEDYRMFFRSALSETRAPAGETAGQAPPAAIDHLHLAHVLSKQNSLLRELRIGDAIRLVDQRIELEQLQAQLAQTQAWLAEARQGIEKLDEEIHIIQQSETYQLLQKIVGSPLSQAAAKSIERLRRR